MQRSNLPSHRDSNCNYLCNDNGGCTVQYVGPPRGGKTAGSCFPDSFGGGCSGTPPECSNCNTVLSCQEPGAGGNSGSVTAIDDDCTTTCNSNGCRQSCRPPAPREVETQSSETPRPPSSGNCQYDCGDWPYSQCRVIKHYVL